jgi:hypothetical protein
MALIVETGVGHGRALRQPPLSVNAAAMSQLLIQLLVSTATVVTTVLVHGFGLAVLVRSLRAINIHIADEGAVRHHVDLSITGPVLLVVLALFVLHGIEIWFYAAIYLALGAVPDLEQAVYFSTITYGTIGYSDAYIVKPWRVLAAIEGINGVILLGWSTAFFVTIVARLRR